jgi:hypothetical protein
MTSLDEAFPNSSGLSPGSYEPSKFPNGNNSFVQKGDATPFAPETIHASECIARYHALLKEIKLLDDQTAEYMANLEQVSTFVKYYENTLQQFSQIHAIFFESLPIPKKKQPTLETEGKPAEATEASDANPAEDLSQELIDLRAAFANPYCKLLEYKDKWSLSLNKKLAGIKEKQDALSSEFSALRQFIAEGIRAMKSENPGSCEGINQCAICFTETVNRVVVPCGHTFCLGCLDTHCGGNAAGRHARYQCPTCRGQMEKVIKLYL